MDLQGKDYRILKLLKGGSLASTSIIEENEEIKVRKEAMQSSAYAFQKLQEQAAWLEKRQHLLPRIPKVLGSGIGCGKFYLDLQYYESIELFDFIHSYPINKSQKIISEILDFCFNLLYRAEKEEINNKKEKMEQLIQKKLMDKTREAIQGNKILQELQKFDRVLINGEETPNLRVLLNEIGKKDTQDSLMGLQMAAIHGDMTVDNIIVIPEFNFVLLDPNPDNIFNTPLVDVAKLLQSFHSGYEFLIKCNACMVDGNSINFEVDNSKPYEELYRFLLQESAKYLKSEDMDNLLFFEALNFSRMLPLKNNINPRTAPIYYGVLLQLLNDFCAKKGT